MSNKSDIRDTLSRLTKKYWFLAGVVLVSALTLFDQTETISGTGRWFKAHYGPEVVIFLIFFCSGLMLETERIQSGLTDVKAMLLALSLIFLVSPLIAGFFGSLPLGIDLKIGIFLVAVMPSTLSSSVVMTGASGGKIAQALTITILANWLCIFTIPFTLSLLLTLVKSATPVWIDKFAIMGTIGRLLIVPLCGGLIIKGWTKSYLNPYEAEFNIINQVFVLGIIWMALSSAREAITASSGMIGSVCLLAVTFHGLLLCASGLMVRYFRLEKGRRESIIFMGCQKTLPLSVILQVSLFPEYGLALVVCVVHHIIQLVMDAYLVGRLKEFD
jgi:sodium/bile acid cotransporter 7